MSKRSSPHADLVLVVDDWPWPAASGMHRRALALLDAARDLGLSVSIASLVPVPPSAVAMVGDTPPTAYDGHWADLHVARGRYWLERGTRYKPSFVAPGMAPFGARAWLDRLVSDLGARATVVSLARNAWIGARLSSRDPTIRILDIVDLLTMNAVLWRRISPYLEARPVDPSLVPRQLLRLDYATRVGAVPDPRELAVVTRFDLTVAISEAETRLLTARHPHARVRWTPHHPSVCSGTNSYGPQALLVMADNPFNIQGYAWLAEHVLPLVLSQAPDFGLVVAGRGSAAVRPVPGVQLLGPVDDLRSLYSTARMTLCPLLAGTGQPTKVAESLAHGVPVVATPFAGSSSQLLHGTDGFVAADAQTFAQHVLHLWREPGLARAMGHQARDRARAARATNELAAALAEVLGSAAPRDSTESARA